jgi:hypothetical protein
MNDSLTVVDGKMIVTKMISKKWRVYFKGERYERGQWSKMIERKFDDFCNHVLNPLEL